MIDKMMNMQIDTVMRGINKKLGQGTVWRGDKALKPRRIETGARQSLETVNKKPFSPLGTKSFSTLTDSYLEELHVVMGEQLYRIERYKIYRYILIHHNLCTLGFSHKLRAYMKTLTTKKGEPFSEVYVESVVRIYIKMMKYIRDYE